MEGEAGVGGSMSPTDLGPLTLPPDGRFPDPWPTPLPSLPLPSESLVGHSPPPSITWD